MDLTRNYVNNFSMLQNIKSRLAQKISSHVGIPSETLESLLEIPKIYDHGHLAFPVFMLAKERKMAPPQVALELAERLQSEALPELAKVQAAGGFLNFTFTADYLQSEIFGDLASKGDQLGFSKTGQGKTIVVDFSSPNVAKPMHVGHLRATVIGQDVYNLAKSQGYNVVGVNHIGDWGSQFGRLAWAYLEWGKEYDFSEKPIDSWLKLYVRFHDELEKNPALETEGAKTFKKLEGGDPEIKAIWQRIINDSFKEYDRLYALMGVKHDVVLGESFYNDKLQDVVDRLQTGGILQESEGAQVVFFDEKDNMPPCLIKKSDGASIYATRDLAAAIYRREKMNADSILYVVAQDQSLHFKQVFKVLEKLNYSWAKDCHHVSFGLYRFKDGKMSTRAGKIILFEDVVGQAVQMVRKMIEEKNPDLADKETVARQVAVGAVFFNDLVNDRVKNVDFDWDRILSMDGDSGPFVQYTVVRCRSILRKLGQQIPAKPTTTLSSEQEQKLIFCLLQFEQVLAVAYRQLKPNILAQYLLDVCSHFSQFYHHHRILGEAPDLALSRAALVKATESVLVQGLKVLNIEAPEAM